MARLLASQLVGGLEFNEDTLSERTNSLLVMIWRSPHFSKNTHPPSLKEHKHDPKRSLLHGPPHISPTETRSWSIFCPLWKLGPCWPCNFRIAKVERELKQVHLWFWRSTWAWGGERNKNTGILLCTVGFPTWPDVWLAKAPIFWVRFWFCRLKWVAFVWEQSSLAATGSAVWCRCNAKAQLVTSKDSCEHPLGDRVGHCQWFTLRVWVNRNLSLGRCQYV